MDMFGVAFLVAVPVLTGRATAFREAGGNCPTLNAGEETLLCADIVGTMLLSVLCTLPPTSRRITGIDATGNRDGWGV